MSFRLACHKSFAGFDIDGILNISFCFLGIHHRFLICPLSSDHCYILIFFIKVELIKQNKSATEQNTIVKTMYIDYIEDL